MTYDEVGPEVFSFLERQQHKYRALASDRKAIGETHFTKIFGESPKARILDALLSSYLEEGGETWPNNLTESDLIQMADLDQEEVSQLPEHISDLEDYGIVSRTVDDETNIAFYSLNRHSEIVDHMLEIDDMLEKHWYQHREI